MPTEAAQSVERHPVGVVEVEAACVDAEQDAEVFAVKDVEAELRDFLCVIAEPVDVGAVFRREQRAPAAGEGVRKTECPATAVVVRAVPTGNASAVSVRLLKFFQRQVAFVA